MSSSEEERVDLSNFGQWGVDQNASDSSSDEDSFLPVVMRGIEYDSEEKDDSDDDGDNREEEGKDPSPCPPRAFSP